MIKTLPRIRSVDAFRAVTMFLMIFVNDIEDIPNTPQWIHHVAEDVDGLGLADVIFPAFLFIVGLSIPFSIKTLSEKSGYNTPLHILKRSVVLMFLGFYFANIETYDVDNALLQRGTWQYLAILSVFLIFLDYSWLKYPWLKYTLQGLGVLLVAALLILYKDTAPAQSTVHFTWWGVLGLIGWAYLYSAFIYYFFGKKLWALGTAWGVFMLVNLASHLGWLEFLDPFNAHIWLAGNGAMQAFAMGGVFVSALYKKLSGGKALQPLVITITALSLLFFAIGFVLRSSTGGISKSFETPAWVFICMAICMLCYLVFVFIVDHKQNYAWVKPIEAAGVVTLTCFMVPDIFYAVLETTDYDYPDMVKDGTGGVIRGIVFAFLMVWAAALLKRINIRLKI